MKVHAIRTEKDWEELLPKWNSLLASSGSGTTFLSWEWSRAWWSAYGKPDELCILTARDESGELRGIAPLRRKIVRRYGQTFSTLTFLADGSSDSDYLDFIIADGFEEAVITAWLGYIDEHLGNVILQLKDLPASSPNLPILKRVSAGRLWEEQSVPCATVRLPAAWDDYLGTVRPRFRTKVRSVLRGLETRRDVSFGICDSAEQLNRLLPALFDLHTRRWNHDGLPGVFGWEAKRKFYALLSPRLLERGALRFSWLEWNGRILSCQYGFVHGSTYLHLQEGYEPASEHWNVGVGLRAWTIREFIRAGITEYDFLGGVGRHKTDWGAEVKESRQIAIAPKNYKNLLYCRGPQWQNQLKATAARVIPEKVLAIRRAGKARPQPVEVTRRTTGEQARRAAAQFYFHLGGVAATRALKGRYEASVSADGKVLRGSWRRRREPSGRILYYHRVNDDRDPFFPSMPLEVFERQMRHLARNYKVVSLAGLVEHLSSGPPEPVVAVTFDDGYRDNHDNAFPVLERYAIPATIFLSTGSVDSGEPLWFEVLAAALKTSGREFLDLEADVPRRFWMRTADERVRANNELFTILRRLPDDERRQRLHLILQALAPPAPLERTNMMLTWDQVRYLKQRGIDFGGHTVTHPYLSRLTDAQVSWQISECKRRIEAELQQPVAHFAYPNGREEDFSAWNKQLIRDAGYRAAVTTVWGPNFRTTDPMELRRGQPWEEDEALFAYKMDWYQLVNG